MHVLPVYMYVHHLDAWCPPRLKKVSDPLQWSYR